MAGVTMQEAEPAGWQQMWESWMRPPPHICPQLLSFTKLKPTWCNRFGSTVPGQDRRQSGARQGRGGEEDKTGQDRTGGERTGQDTIKEFCLISTFWSLTSVDTNVHWAGALKGQERVCVVPVEQEPSGTFSRGSAHDLQLWMETTFCFC